MARTSTIDWMIKFIGDRGEATRQDILTGGRAAGHSTSTLRHYMGSAALFGHVAVADCDTKWHKWPRRIEYFRRSGRGRYTLNEAYIHRYLELCTPAAADSRLDSLSCNVF